MASLVVLGTIYLEDSESTQPWRIQVQLRATDQKAKEAEHLAVSHGLRNFAAYGTVHATFFLFDFFVIFFIFLELSLME